jgi:hypothetical protein
MLNERTEAHCTSFLSFPAIGRRVIARHSTGVSDAQYPAVTTNGRFLDRPMPHKKRAASIGGSSFVAALPADYPAWRISTTLPAWRSSIPKRFENWLSKRLSAANLILGIPAFSEA